MRLRKEHGVKEKLEEHKDLVVFLEESKKMELEGLFNNDNPIKAEFGIGKGRFIIEMAKRNPDVNYIGIELRDQVLLKAVKKANEEKIKNIKFLVANIENITDIFEENSLDGIYLNFSDPWPKKRHFKRRLTYREFISKYNMILKENSWIRFKTDNISLFQFTLNELAELRLIMKEISLDVHEDDRFIDNIMTEYEEKFSKKGNKIMSVTFMPHQ